jgi:hypothetical protein
MKIEPSQIAEKKSVGKTSDGQPVVMILTHGGLYAFFTKDEGQIETLGLAPHKAIAAWMSEKKCDITWNDGFLKSEGSEYEELTKSEAGLFKKLRKTMLSPVLTSSPIKMDGYYYIYNTNTFDIGLMHKADIATGLRKGEISPLSLVRLATLEEPVGVLKMHKEFARAI